MSNNKLQIPSKAILPIIIVIGVLAMSFMPDNSPAVQSGQLNDQPQYEILKAEASDYESQAQKLEEEAKLKAQKAEALKKLAETEEAITNLDVEQKVSVTTIETPAIQAQAVTLVNDHAQWVATIDKYIAETNPALSNGACGQANGQIWVDAGVKYGNHPYFLVAIAQADTSLGKGLTNKCNLGNTGHCDSCAKGHQYKSYANSIYSISQTLSNQYLGKGTKSCHFSVGGWDHCPEGKTVNGGKFYASSKVNWNRNVNATLAKLHGTEFKQDFNVKI